MRGSYVASGLSSGDAGVVPAASAAAAAAAAAAAVASAEATTGQPHIGVQPFHDTCANGLDRAAPYYGTLGGRPPAEPRLVGGAAISSLLLNPNSLHPVARGATRRASEAPTKASLINHFSDPVENPGSSARWLLVKANSIDKVDARIPRLSQELR